MTVVAVLAYRAIDQLRAGTLDSIVAAARRVRGREVHVICLDNYSRDGSVQWLLENAPAVDLLLSPRNILYCRGVNALVRYGHRRFQAAEYILVDADNPAAPDAYAKLVAFGDEHPDHGIVQPLVCEYGDRRRLYSCGHRYTDDHWCLPMKDLPADPAELLDLPSCSISSTLVRREVFEACGLLDPLLEIYYESADLCFRARAKGFRIACCTEAITLNEGTEAEGPDSMHHRRYFNRNRLLFWRMHDRAIFAVVELEAAQRLAELEARRARLAYGLDAVDESIRQGLEEGLRLTRDARLFPRPSIPLNAYDSSEAVVVRRSIQSPEG